MDEEDSGEFTLVAGPGDSKLPVSLEAKQLYLRELARTASTSMAAKAAFPQMKLASAMAYARKLKKQDPEFAEAFRLALVEAQGTAEAVAYDHAINGTDKPVFYEGDQVDTIKEYDHKLLLTVIRRNARLLGDPSWEEPKAGAVVDNSTTNVQINNKVSFRKLPKAERDAIIAHRKQLVEKGVIDVTEKKT